MCLLHLLRKLIKFEVNTYVRVDMMYHSGMNWVAIRMAYRRPVGLRLTRQISVWSCSCRMPSRFGAGRVPVWNCTVQRNRKWLQSDLYFRIVPMRRGPGSSVGIATELRAGRSGIESRWGRDFPPIQTGPGAHPASCKMGTGYFPGVKCRPGRAGDHSPPPSAVVIEE